MEENCEDKFETVETSDPEKGENSGGEGIDENKTVDVKNEKKDDDEDNECKCSWAIIPMIPILLISLVFLVSSIVFIYVSFAEILNITFYPICYEWISLFSKFQTVHIVFSIFATLSDFGFFILLFKFIYVFVKQYTDVFISSSKYLIIHMYDIVRCKQAEYLVGDQKIPAYTPFGIVLFIFIYIINITIFILSIFYKDVLLVYTLFSTLSYLFCLVLLSCCSSVIGCMVCNNREEDDVENTPQQLKLSDIIKTKHGEGETMDYIQTCATSIMQRNMCSAPVTCCDEKRCYKIFKYILGIFVIMSQTYIIVISCMNYKYLDNYGKAGVVIGVIFKIFFIGKNIDFNIFDSVINFTRTWKRSQGEGRIALILVIIIYFLGICSCIAILIASNNYDFPYVDYLEYTDLHTEEWKKFENSTYIKPSPAYCGIASDVNIPMTTPDFAVLTTLPRLYGINDAGKCYIKPKFRGVFNSTMKYVFGDDYNDQGITIYCWPKMHYPYLILTSQRFLHASIEALEDNYELLEGKEEYVSQEYFNDTDTLCDNDNSEQCIELQQCLREGNNDCAREWNLYTNAYWREQTDSYVEGMKGLEQYQVTIEDDFLFQPDYIIQKDNTLMAGKHYIIGGGSEDQWGYASLLENFVRVNIPSFFEDFIPFYGTFSPYFRGVINAFSQFALGFFYVENLSTNELLEFGNLIMRFNFSHTCIYMVGHTLSGTTMKELSYLSDVNGIAFEASRGNGYAEYKVSPEFQAVNEHTNKIANIYSESFILTGYDEEFSVNGQLPHKFYNPNVYDTACMTIAACSLTKQYYQFCNQVLNQHGEDSEANFKEVIDAYVNE